MSSPPLATRWSTSVSYCWYNTGNVWAHKNPVEGKKKPYLSKSGAAFDPMKMTSIAKMATWQRSGTTLYSTTSNRNHVNVAPARTPADTFLFFHRRMSAAAKPNTGIRKYTALERNYGNADNVE